MSEAAISPYALVVYFSNLGTMLGAGVQLLRSLHALSEALEDERLREVNARLAEAVEAGKTLSQAMCDHPDVFSTVAVYMVRAGEVGGVLDVTAERLAQYLREDLELREWLFLRAELARLRSASTGEEAERRVHEALARAEARLSEILFCRAFGLMLASGVPVLRAVDSAAEVYPPDVAEPIRRAARALANGERLTDSLRKLRVFSVTTLELFWVGEETGQLDFMASKAADLLETQAACTVREALAPD